MRKLKLTYTPLSHSRTTERDIKIMFKEDEIVMEEYVDDWTHTSLWPSDDNTRLKTMLEDTYYEDYAHFLFKYMKGKKLWRLPDVIIL